MIQVDVQGLPQLTVRLGKIADWANAGVRKTVEDAAKHFIDSLPPDPAPSGKSMLPYIKSKRQFNWLMWAISSGEITIPYRRTGEIRESLKTEVRQLGGEFVGTVFSISVGAPYVIDEQLQAAYHKGTWWTLQGEMRKKTRNILDIFVDALRKVVHG
jgi:hypothetical protein